MITRRIATAREYGETKVVAMTDEFTAAGIKTGEEVFVTLIEDEQGARRITIEPVARPKK